VVGVNTAINSMSGGSEGVGFATPSNIAKKVFNDLAKKGRVSRGWLGVGLQDVTPELAAHFKVPEGVLVTQVFRNSPAEKSELRRGDVITSFNGARVKNIRALQGFVGSAAAGSEAAMTVSRDGREKEVKIKIGERTPEKISAAAIKAPATGPGMSVAEVTDEVARAYGMSRKSGVVVTAVDGGSPAEQAGVMAGDVIHEMNGMEIKRVADYEKAAAEAANRGDVVLLIERRDAMIYIAFRIR
jgi:serine protease Do